jgi:hypothetical protein
MAYILDKMADAVADFTGTEKGGAFGQLEEHFKNTARAAGSLGEAKKGTAAWDDPTVPELLAEAIGGMGPGLAQAIVAAYTAGPIVGFAALSALGVADQEAKVIAEEASKGAIIGALFHFLAPFSRATRAGALGGATYMMSEQTGAARAIEVAEMAGFGALAKRRPRKRKPPPPKQLESGERVVEQEFEASRETIDLPAGTEKRGELPEGWDINDAIRHGRELGMTQREAEDFARRVEEEYLAGRIEAKAPEPKREAEPEAPVVEAPEAPVAEPAPPKRPVTEPPAKPKKRKPRKKAPVPPPGEARTGFNPEDSKAEGIPRDTPREQLTARAGANLRRELAETERDLLRAIEVDFYGRGHGREADWGKVGNDFLQMVLATKDHFKGAPIRQAKAEIRSRENVPIVVAPGKKAKPGKLLDIVGSHASKDETRYNLNQVYVESEGRLVATDGHRLLLVETEHGLEPGTYRLPETGAKEWRKVEDAEFVDYPQVIPKMKEADFQRITGDQADAIAESLRVTMQRYGWTAAAKAAEGRLSGSNVGASIRTHTGFPLNGLYLRDALDAIRRILPGEMVEMGRSSDPKDTLGPVILRATGKTAEGKPATVTQVTMPIRADGFVSLRARWEDFGLKPDEKLAELERQLDQEHAAREALKSEKDAGAEATAMPATIVAVRGHQKDRLAQGDRDYDADLEVEPADTRIQAARNPAGFKYVPHSRFEDTAAGKPQVGQPGDQNYSPEVLGVPKGHPSRQPEVRKILNAGRIARRLHRALKLPVQWGNVSHSFERIGGDVLGYWQPWRGVRGHRLQTGVMRVREHGSLQVDAHEFGHGLADVYGFQEFYNGSALAKSMREFRKKYQAETGEKFDAKGLGEERTYEAAHRYGDERVKALYELMSISYDATSGLEGFAEWSRVWLTRPERLREVVPNASRLIEARINTDGKMTREQQDAIHAKWDKEGRDWKGWSRSKRNIELANTQRIDPNKFGDSHIALSRGQRKALYRAQKEFSAYYVQSLAESMQGKIGKQGRYPGSTIMTGPGDYIHSLFFDAGWGLESAGWALGGAEGANKLATLMSNHRGVNRLAEGMLQWGPPSIAADGFPTFEKRGHRGLLDIVSEIAGDSRSEQAAFRHIIAERAQSLLTTDRIRQQLGMDVKGRFIGHKQFLSEGQIREALSDPSDAVLRFSSKIKDYHKQVLQFARDTGYVSEKAFQDIQKWEPAYTVAFMREQQYKGKSKSNLGRGQPGLERMRGSTLPLVDTMHALMVAPARLVRASMENSKKLDMLDWMSEQQGSGRYFQRRRATRGVIKLRGGQMIRVNEDIARAIRAEFEELGLELPREFDAMLEDPGLLNRLKILLPEGAPHADRLVTVFREGKPEHYEIFDDLMWDAFVDLHRPVPGKLRRFGRALARFKKGAITSTPAFALRMLVRDVPWRVMMTRHTKGYVGNTIKGYGDALFRTKKYREARAAGFGSGSLFEGGSMDVKDALWRARFRSKPIQTLLRRAIPHPVNIVTNARDAYHMIEHLNRSLEQGPRMGEFRGAEMAGKDRSHAAYYADETMVDFSKRGSWEGLNVARDLIPFASASINGNLNFYTHTGMGVPVGGRGVSAGKFRTGAIATTAIGAQVAGYLLNRGNQWFDDLPDYIKHAYTNLMIQGKHYLLIPMWEVSSAAGVITRTIEEALGSDDRAEQAWGYFMANSFLGQFGLDFPAPAGLDDIIEQSINRNLYTDRPIVPGQVQDLPPGLQAKLRTPAVLRHLGQAIEQSARRRGHIAGDDPMIPNFLESPARVETFARSWLSDWAETILHGVSRLAYPEEEEEWAWWEYPGIRSFYAEENRWNRKDSIFWDASQELKRVNRAADAYEQQHEYEIADEIPRGSAETSASWTASRATSTSIRASGPRRGRPG